MSMFTTPPGKSLVAITSPSEIAGSGKFSLAIKIAELPPARTGASALTVASNEGFASAKTATTPNDSGVVKL